MLLRRASWCLGGHYRLGDSGLDGPEIGERSRPLLPRILRSSTNAVAYAPRAELVISSRYWLIPANLYTVASSRLTIEEMPKYEPHDKDESRE